MMQVVLASFASVLWIVAFGFGVRSGSLYPALSSLALVIVLLSVMGVSEVRQMLKAPPRAALQIALGLLIGGLTLAFTHALFPIVTKMYPPAAGEVVRLYSVAAVTPRALVAVVLVIIAEEVLWRGTLPRALERSMPGVPPVIAYALATVLYTAAQLGVGSGLLGLAALMLGALWSFQALATRSLWMSLVSHAVWTLGVLGFWPLVSPTSAP
jgi:membrane protease YdiL (CAAX protease family)